MSAKKSIGIEFMKRTRQSELPVPAQRQGAPLPPLELPVPEFTVHIPLPHPADLKIPAIDLRLAIERRHSLRSYREQPLTLDELSFLLWCTQGVKTVTERPVAFRNVPSAGARHAFETYLLINRVDELAPGLYRYLALDHSLAQQDLSPEINQKITLGCFKQDQIATSAVTFIWAAVVERMTWRYPERGYRYLHLDAGHVCQNLYLAAEAVDCGVCAIAAFDDDALNALLELDGEAVFAIYAASLGKKAE
jgi:SagB-type dehydrogenase family enzyme